MSDMNILYLLYFIKILSQFNKPIVLIHDVDPLLEEEQRDIEELRKEGYTENKIEHIKFRKRNFKENEKIRTEIEKYPEKIGLITISSNFETLIGISPKKSSKPYKAFKFLKGLTKENISDSLKNLIQFIIEFRVKQVRDNLEHLNIICNEDLND